MRKWSLFAILFVSLAQCQTAKYQNWCQVGAQKVITVGTASSSTAQVSMPSCTVTVYLHGTLTLATIYADQNNTPLANPFTANTDASYGFYATSGVRYDVVTVGTIQTISGPSTQTVNISDIIPGGGGGGGGGSGTVTSVATGAGLTGGPCTVTCTISIASGAVTNAMLQNPSITVSLSGGLSGSASVALGGTLNIAGNGAAGIVSTCNTAKALGIYSGTGTTIGCDPSLTESGTQILYGSNGTSLLPAFSFSSVPDSGLYTIVSPTTYAITTATRTSNVSTLNMSSLPTGMDVMYVGGRIHVAGVTVDTTFNGDWTIASITGTTITFNQIAANSVAGSGGTVAPWMTGIGGYQAAFNHIMSNSSPVAPLGFIRLGATDQINFYCPGGSTLNGTNGCNLISGNGNSPSVVGDGQGVLFSGPGTWPGNGFDFFTTSVFNPCTNPAHSCFGISNDGNFYTSELGGTPIRVGKVLSVFGMTGVVANLSGAVTTSGSSVTSMGEIIVPVAAGYCQGTIGTANATTYILAPFVNVANSNACTGTAAMEFPVPAPCIAKDLYVVATAAGAVAGSGVVTLYKNGSATTLTCTLGTGTTCNDTTHLPTFVAGDTYSLRVLTGQATDTTAGVRAAFACQT